MTSEQLRMARAATRLGVRELAGLAGVSPATVTRYEGGKGGINMRSAEAIKGALEALGVRFIAKGQEAPDNAVMFDPKLGPIEERAE